MREEQKTGQCKLTNQLLALEACSQSGNPRLPEYMSQVVTPLKLTSWTELLGDHPDPEFTGYILRGIEKGFRVGFNPKQCQLQSRGTNMISAAEQPGVVSKYLADEVAAGRVIKVHPPLGGEAVVIHCSPFGVIPKKNRPNRWRLIVDLSSPEGHSVNDGIDRELASLSYVSVDDVVSRVLRLGKGARLAKMDIKQAYRNVPVHPNDRSMLGMSWKGEVFVDATLPFGLRSAPLIFTALADALQWIMKKRGASWLEHYLDDFVTVGPPGSQECMENMMIMHAACKEVGLPVEADKDEGPATVITFLGIELDTEGLEIRLPQEKLQHTRAILACWRGRKACRKRELLSLIGVLSHASKAVRAGRSFLRRLIDLSTTARHLDQYIRLNREARADIEWWHRYSEQWNGTAMMAIGRGAAPIATVISDASGNWGCGAYSGMSWFMLKWSGPIRNCHITVKELAPIVVAAALWGRNWTGETVWVRCDNSAVVSIINCGTSKNAEAMQLMRCLAFIAARLEFRLVASHIRGVDNILADALSRDNLLLFRTLLPQANPEPEAIPEAVLDLLFLQEPDWTSRSWTDQWSSTFGTA